MPGPGRDEVVAAFDAEYAAIAELVTTLGDDDLLEPSGCRGWSVADLLFHMLLDAQRALVTFHSPAPGPADVDFVTYWKGFRATEDRARAHARFVRSCAAAHSSARGIASRWLETARAARRAAAGADAAFVTTQGHVLATPDFVATLVVEATVHHLDLVEDLANGEGPTSAGLALAATTLDGLLGGPRPGDWDDPTYVRKATGRVPLADEDRAALGSAVAALPLFS